MSDAYTYYNDSDSYCCAVLRKNIERGLLPEGVVDDQDIREVQATELMGYQHIHIFAGIGGFPLGFRWAGVPERLRIITGGFPCQDISNSGKRVGITGERSGLWKEMLRLVCEIRPDYAIMENVAALVNRGLSTVLGGLAEDGYDAEWFVLSAAQFGAPHLRERVFIVAYPTSSRCEEQSNTGRVYNQSDPSSSCDVSNPNSDRCWIWQDQQICQPERKGTPDTGYDGTQESMAHPSSPRWEECQSSTIASYERHTTRIVDTSESEGVAQCGVCGGTDGVSTGIYGPHRWPSGPGQEQHDSEPPRVIQEKVPHRADRLKALGNAILPQCAEYIGRLIIEMEREHAATH